ncbi:MAG: DUF1592 domain-containing protein [Planctomycetia bacterium]|nr:DUF1592 domain-containing protein [Planctomycetia bacterium]
MRFRELSFRAARATTLLALLAGSWVCLAERATAEDDFVLARLRPFLAQHCLACHSGEEPKGDLSLEKYQDAASVRRDRDTWGKVVEYLEGGIMPPEERPRPNRDEVAAVTAWANKQLAALGDGQRNPGRVTIRRLNRAEYNNTIRDLVGVAFKPAEDFPTDDVGYGFDNIGDVLSLPPVLLEKYLAAAERIASEAIQASPQSSAPAKARFAPAQMKLASGGDGEPTTGILVSNGEVFVDVPFTSDGEYIVRAGACAQQAGPDPARMALKVDGKDVQSFEVKATADRPEAYEVRLTIEAGTKRIAVAFVNDYYQPNHPDPKQRDRNLFVDCLEIEGPLGDAPTLPDSHRRIIFRQPTDVNDADACAKEILAKFARRAYRRTVSETEVERLLRFVRLARADGGTFEAGIQLAVQAVLVSPSFLFRVELDGDAASGAPTQPIDDFQLASRLSYFLWSSMPDDELTRLADEGALAKGDNLAAQVKRMLADEKAAALVENFAGQWLQIRNLDIAAPDRMRFKDFDDGLRAAMRRETELFFESVMREDRSILEFIDADYTFVNDRLAKHYGIEGVDGKEFRRVSLPDKRRGGVLTHASILTVTSNPTRTSPVKRGKWIMEQILGTPPPPPPPGVQELEQGKLEGTLRQKMEQHRANPNCAVCHNRMDPLGFAFENFDAIGAWRDREGEQTIDAGGTLPGGQTFAGATQLRAILKAAPEPFARNLVRKMLTYALGRGLESYDNEAVNEITSQLAAHDYKFSTLVVAVVKSEPFRMRRAKGVE